MVKRARPKISWLSAFAGSNPAPLMNDHAWAFIRGNHIDRIFIMIKKRVEAEVKKEIKRRIKKTEVRILIGIVLVLIILNYSSLDRQLENFLYAGQQVHVDRIIDGDTIEAENRNESIRLLGINTPERGEFFYDEAKDFLENELLNKNATLEFMGDRYDKYGRTLAYVFLGKENINVKMVENGFANHYFYGGRDKYSDELFSAWEMCIEKNVNLCEKSNDACSACIKISGSSLINSCSFSCNITNWQVRGEGREKFIFSGKTLSPRGKPISFLISSEIL